MHLIESEKNKKIEILLCGLSGLGTCTSPSLYVPSTFLSPCVHGMFLCVSLTLTLTNSNLTLTLTHKKGGI